MRGWVCTATYGRLNEAVVESCTEKANQAFFLKGKDGAVG